MAVTFVFSHLLLEFYELVAGLYVDLLLVNVLKHGNEHRSNFFKYQTKLRFLFCLGSRRHPGSSKYILRGGTKSEN